MRDDDPYTLHRQFIAPAWYQRGLWRVVVVVLGFEAAFEATPYLLARLAQTDTPQTTTPAETLLDFGAFLLPCLVLLLLVRLVHRRGLSSLTGPWPAFWRDLRRVVLAVGLVLIVQEPLRLWSEWDFIDRVRPLAQWAMFVPLGLLVLLIQTGTEELYFRGYLQQQMAVRAPSPWVWMGLPSVFFGLAHVYNGTNAVDGLVWGVWATMLGLACADLTARTGNLGAAVGLHLANNAAAILITGAEGWPASGLALFLYAPGIDDAASGPTPASGAFDLVFMLLGVLTMWLAARIAIRR